MVYSEEPLQHDRQTFIRGCRSEIVGLWLFGVSPRLSLLVSPIGTSSLTRPDLFPPVAGVTSPVSDPAQIEMALHWDRFHV